MTARWRSHRDVVVDVVCVVGALAVSSAFLAVVVAESDPARAEVVVQVVVGVASCLALWWRRRWPVALALIMVPASVLSAMVQVTGLIMVFTVAVHRRFPVAVAVATAFWLPSTVLYWVEPDPDMSYLSSLLLAAAFTSMATGWGLFVRSRRQLVAPLRARAVEAEADQQRRLVHARHLERSRIAGEMHDVLGHRLSLLSMHAGALAFRPDAPPEQLAGAASVVAEQARAALDDLREVIGVLRDEPDTDTRPPPTLAHVLDLVDESRRAGVEVHARVGVADLGAVPPALGRSGYRIVQEALTNARRHAPGAHVDVAIDGSAADGVTIVVTNACPQPGGAPDARSTGLVGLVERARLAGGTLEHGTTPDGAFRVSSWLPWTT